MSESTRQYDLIVIGAGIIGASIAYHASTNGLKVKILDAKGPYAGASGASDGAISICTKTNGVLSRLASSALRYYEVLSSGNNVLSQVYHKRPSYYFSSDETEDEALIALISKLKNIDSTVSMVSSTSGYNAIHGITENVRQIIEVSGEGHMPGYTAVEAYLSGTNIEKKWPCKLSSYEEINSIVYVHTDQGVFKSSYLILATGVSTNDSIASISKLPIFPRTGQMIVTDRSTRPLLLRGALTSASYLLSKSQKQMTYDKPPIVIDPLNTGQYLIGSSREQQRDPRRTDFKTIRHLLKHAATCYRPILDRKVIRVFAGVRAAVKDGIPIVGAISSSSRIMVATGFEGDGICLSAIIGRDLVNNIMGGAISTDMKLLSPERFVH